MPVNTKKVVEFVKTRVLADPGRRREKVRKWLEYYQGEQKKHVPANRDETEGHFAGRPKITVNLTRKIIDAKSCLYDEGAVRDTGDDVVRQFWADVDIDQRMRENDPVVRLCGTLFCFPDYITGDRDFWQSFRDWFLGTPDDGRFCLHAYTPDRVEVMLNPAFPEVPELICVFGPTADGGTWTQAWSSRKYWELRQDQVVVNGKRHNFGRPPFVAMRNEVNWTKDFWGCGEGDNIVNQNEEINRLCSSLQWLVICQSHGQWVGKNLPENWVPKIGTDKIVMIYPDPDLPDDADCSLDLVAPVADVSGLKDTIDWQMDKLCESADVAAGAMRLDMNRQSGDSLREKRIATHQYRKRRRPVALGWERELAAMAKIAKAARLKKGILRRRKPVEMPEIRVDFREPELPMQTGDRVQREQHEIQTGQVTVPGILQRHNPDLSAEEAEKLHEGNLAYNQAHASRAVESSLLSVPPTDEARKQAEDAIAAAAGGGE